MPESVTIELTNEQQELLLQGLRFVRSSVALDFQIPSDEVTAQRQQQYQQIAAIESLLKGKSSRQTAQV